MDGLGLCVRSSVLIDKTMLGQAPLHFFSETKDCRVVMPENWGSELSSRTGVGLYVGPSHPKTLSEMTKPWLENRQSWIIKIGAEFIIQVSLVLPQRRLHDGHNYLFHDVKISNFKNWFIEVWMSTETGRVTISRFPLTQMNKARYYKQLWFVLCYKLDGLLLLIYRNVLLLLWKAYVLRPRKSWMGQQVWLNSFLQPCWDW